MPSGFTIFCDDIRAEVGGKRTYVGVYGPVMYVGQSLPAIIPKLCLAITYSEEKDGENPPPNSELMVYLIGDPDEKPTFRTPIDFAGAYKENKVHRPLIEGGTIVSAQSDVILSPFVVNSEGKIKVQVSREGKILKIGTLAIKKGVASGP